VSVGTVTTGPAPGHVLAVSTTSMGKLGEIAALVRRVKLPVPLRLVTTLEVAPDLVVLEDGLTFTENAVKKARALAERTRMLVIADDSGLEVDLLNGAPGLHSARYAGTGGRSGTDEANRDKLLAELTRLGAWDDPAKPVTARFRCVLALLDPLGASDDGTSRGTLVTADGVCEGSIVREGRGQRGFGYDPLFVPSAGQATGRTMAELGFEEKLVTSHRGRAFEALVPGLTRVLEARKKAVDDVLAVTS
jgi:XTP/dITP diphosphohydrolase